MQRRDFMTLLGAGAAAAWPLTARAQQRNAVKRLGWLTTGAENDPLNDRRSGVFEPELQRLGWAVGRNLEIDHRHAGGDNNRLRVEAMDLVARAPDVIATTGTFTTSTLKQLTNSIPIVFTSVADPVASGFVASLERPGGNLTGFISVEYSLGGKWVSILKDIAPGVERVLVLHDPDNTNWTGYLPVIESAAQSLRLNVGSAQVMTIGDVESAVGTFAREPRGGMIILPGSGMMTLRREAIVELAIRHRLPAVYPFDYFAESGGLVSYGSDSRELYRGAASYVARILRGVKPADLPVQAPVKFELVINLKAAKAIGIELPYNLLLLADRVID
jgi:putative tryptophan/tyrosine transport system substrate-binding protein